MTFWKVLLWMRYCNPQFLKESHEIRYSFHLKIFIVEVFHHFSKEDGSVLNVDCFLNKNAFKSTKSFQRPGKNFNEIVFQRTQLSKKSQKFHFSITGRRFCIFTVEETFQNVFLKEINGNKSVKKNVQMHHINRYCPPV